MRRIFLALLLLGLITAGLAQAQDSVVTTRNCVLNSDAVESVTAAADTLTMTAHSFVNGDAVTYNADAEAECGIARSATYYVCNKAADTIQLDDTSTACSSILDITACTPTGSIIKTSSNIAGSWACRLAGGTWQEQRTTTGNGFKSCFDKVYRSVTCDVVITGTVTAATVRIEGSIYGGTLFDTDGLATEILDSSDFSGGIGSFVINDQPTQCLRSNITTLTATAAPGIEIVCTGIK